MTRLVAALQVSCQHTISTLPELLTNTDIRTARYTTDGTDEHDFATQLQAGKRQPARVQRQVMPPTNNNGPTAPDYASRPSHPRAVHVHGVDGHRSDSLHSAVNHPDDRPRAHHKPSSSHHEMASDRSYQSGPSVESGSSSA
jgi:aquaporin related protein